MSRDPFGIGRNIRRLRQARGKRVDELAYEAGIASVTWYLYERGRRNPRAAVVEKIASALGVSMRELLRDTKNDKI